MKDAEHYDQVALFGWAARMEGQYPELRLLFAIPNGGHRHPAVAARMKAEGVKRGVPDVFLPVSNGLSHGLWIEMKHGKNKTTPEQDQWINDLRRMGYAAEVCWSTNDAIRLIESYLARLHRPPRGYPMSDELLADYGVLKGGK